MYTHENFLNQDQTETFSIVSTVAYLSGVQAKHFGFEYEPLRYEIYEELEQNTNAKIIRHLCTLRNQLEQNFSFINEAIRYQMKSLYTIPEFVSVECVKELDDVGIHLVNANQKTNQYIMDINQHIANRISNCKELFPEWVVWDYVKALFIMPKGTTEQGAKRAAAEYYMHKNQYPYQVYLNWKPFDCGNLFANDRRFLKILYTQNGDRFTAFEKVSDATRETKEELYQFLKDSEKSIVAVDCENADPYKFFSMLESLDKNALLDRIEKIMLFNDVNASAAWSVMEQYTYLPVEHHMTKRIKENKSVVDMSLAVSVCQEVYRNNISSVLLVSSDSDYWAMISAMMDCNFFVVMEDEKCSDLIKTELKDKEIPYCSMDRFCTASSSKLAVPTVLKEFQAALVEVLDTDIFALLEQAYKKARVTLSEEEKSLFYDRYIRSARVRFSDGGHLQMQFGG